MKEALIFLYLLYSKTTMAAWSIKLNEAIEQSNPDNQPLLKAAAWAATIFAGSVASIFFTIAGNRYRKEQSAWGTVAICCGLLSLSAIILSPSLKPF